MPNGMSTRVDDWIYERLTTEPSAVAAFNGRVYPDDTAPPEYDGVFARPVFQAAPILLGLGGVRIKTTLVYVVHAVAETQDWDQVEAGQDAIYDALHGKTGGVVYSCVCEAEERMPQDDTDPAARYLGWRIRLEAA